MELTQTYKGKTTISNSRTSVGASVLRFISKHAGVFEALSRQGQPFGGSLLPRHHPEPTDKADHPDGPITRVQQQLDEVNRMVATLNEEVRVLHTHTTSVNKPDGNRAKTTPKQDAWKQVIGIERFRALQQS